MEQRALVGGRADDADALPQGLAALTKEAPRPNQQHDGEGLMLYKPL